MNNPPVTGVLETALYVADPEQSLRFYQRIFGFREILRQQDRLIALSVADRQVLLLFRRECCREAMDIPGGRIPAHDGSGTLHFAFGIAKADVEKWRDWLRQLDVPVSSEVEFPRGGRSIYLRDPDNHLVELITPGIWDLPADSVINSGL
ncbi:MAG: VOC family protein [Bryobacteraceae bacterium]|nr:VOC family protein [Bryobacteraceae bacterium]